MNIVININNILLLLFNYLIGGVCKPVPLLRSTMPAALHSSMETIIHANLRVNTKYRKS